MEAARFTTRHDRLGLVLSYLPALQCLSLCGDRGQLLRGLPLLLPSDAILHSARWSPCGRFVAYLLECSRSPHSDVYLCDLLENRVDQLDGGHWPAENVQWITLQGLHVLAVSPKAPDSPLLHLYHGRYRVAEVGLPRGLALSSVDFGNDMVGTGYMLTGAIPRISAVSEAYRLINDQSLMNGLRSKHDALIACFRDIRAPHLRDEDILQLMVPGCPAPVPGSLQLQAFRSNLDDFRSLASNVLDVLAREMAAMPGQHVLVRWLRALNDSLNHWQAAWDDLQLVQDWLRALQSTSDENATRFYCTQAWSVLKAFEQCHGDAHCDGSIVLKALDEGQCRCSVLGRRLEMLPISPGL